MLDKLQIIFWSVTYLLIILAGWRSRELKQVSMPYVAGVLNFGWELCALQQSQGFWGHILWLGLDVVIYSIGFLSLNTGKRRSIYIILTYMATTAFWYIFTLPNGMLISSFAIDVIMAVMFLVDRKQLSPDLKVPVAVCKLIGDVFAGIYYGRSSGMVAIMAVMVSLCNCCYLWLCCREKQEKGTENR